MQLAAPLCSGSDAANHSADNAVVALTVHQEADFEDAAKLLVRMHKVLDDDWAVLDGSDVGASELMLLEDVRECLLDHVEEDVVDLAARLAALQSIRQNHALVVFSESGLGELLRETPVENLRKLFQLVKNNNKKKRNKILPTRSRPWCIS